MNQENDKRNFIKYPGAILIVCIIVASIVSINVYIKLGGTGEGILDGLIIGAFIALLLYPVFKWLGPSLKYENEKLIIRKIERLISNEKYNKANKLLRKNEINPYDKDSFLKLKERLKEKNK